MLDLFPFKRASPLQSVVRVFGIESLKKTKMGRLLQNHPDNKYLSTLTLIIPY